MLTPRRPPIATVHAARVLCVRAPFGWALAVPLLVALLASCGGQRFALRDTPTRDMPAAQAVGELQTDA